MKKFINFFICISFVTCIWACAPATITVTGPVTGGLGKPWGASIPDLSAHGYVEEEFFFESIATAYILEGGMRVDGMLSVLEWTRAPFKTRLLVRMPLDPAKFNGTVVVEWLNVSAGADGDPGFMYNWQEILREGYAYVGVSAQATGVEGGGFSLMEDTVPLKQYDPERYGPLCHPGDAYCYDIYTKAASVIRGYGDMDVLGGLIPERLIAYGESQSAMTMITYVNALHPITKAFDGYFIHSRMASGMPVCGADMFSMMFSMMGRVKVRTDLDVPVFQFLTESDTLGIFGFSQARQPDTELIRTWEVAGTAHADKYILDLSADMETEGDEPGMIIDCENINDGPQHFVIKAALYHLNQWIANGTAPPKAQPLTTGELGNPCTDEHGNTLGGVRTPDVDVPIAKLSGQGSGDILCMLFGSTTPFTPEKLLELYPNHDDYVAKVTASANQAREAGFILAPEEQAIVEEAQAALIPF